jgi:hypothetical protein
MRQWALRLFARAALTLFFLNFRAEIASAAAEPDFSVSLGGYVVKMLIALLIFSAAGYALAKYLPGRIGGRSGARLRLIAALSLGKDMVYIVRTGPQVAAILVSRSGSVVIGRWSAEEWDDYESAAEATGRGSTGSDAGS